jgi:amidase
MARHVEDLIAVMPLLARGDGHDPTVIEMPFLDPAAVEFRSLRVAFYTDNGIARANRDVAGLVTAAAQELAGKVRSVKEAWPSCLADSYDLEMKLIGPDGGAGLRDYLKSIGSERLHPLLSGWLNKLECYRTDLAGFARYWGELDSYRAEMRAFFRDYDVILCPVYPQPALLHGTSIEDDNFRSFSHTMAFNLTGWPAAVVRCGESGDGLPIAVQIVAHPFREDVALAVAKRLEQIFGGWKAPR